MIDGHPESFQLETAGTRVFANLPGLLSSQIVAGDRKTMAVDARSPSSYGGNYPMALDEQTSRIFVGCRRPTQLAVIDTRSGKTVSSAEIAEDAPATLVIFGDLGGVTARGLGVILHGLTER